MPPVSKSGCQINLPRGIGFGRFTGMRDRTVPKRAVVVSIDSVGRDGVSIGAALHGGLPSGDIGARQHSRGTEDLYFGETEAIRAGELDPHILPLHSLRSESRRDLVPRSDDCSMFPPGFAVTPDYHCHRMGYWKPRPNSQRDGHRSNPCDSKGRSSFGARHQVALLPTLIPLPAIFHSYTAPKSCATSIPRNSSAACGLLATMIINPPPPAPASFAP